MQEEFERDDPFLGIGRRTRELGGELVDLVQNAIVRGTVGCRGIGG